MKKIAAILMSLMMMGAIAAYAAEDVLPTYILEGSVIEIYGDGESFLMEDYLAGQVIVHVSDTTQIRMDGALEAGQYVLVEYSGAMTFSLPGQISALSVTSYLVEGEVLSIQQDGEAVLLMTEQFGELIVKLPEDSKDAPLPGSYARVYFSGAMTASLPGQISAWQVDSFVRFEGKVGQVSERGILISAEDGQSIIVRVDEDTVFADEVKEGDQVEVLHNGILTRSFPPQGRAIYLRVMNIK